MPGSVVLHSFGAQGEGGWFPGRGPDSFGGPIQSATPLSLVRSSLTRLWGQGFCVDLIRSADLRGGALEVRVAGTVVADTGITEAAIADDRPAPSAPGPE